MIFSNFSHIPFQTMHNFTPHSVCTAISLPAFAIRLTRHPSLPCLPLPLMDRTFSAIPMPQPPRRPSPQQDGWLPPTIDSCRSEIIIGIGLSSFRLASSLHTFSALVTYIILVTSSGFLLIFFLCFTLAPHIHSLRPSSSPVRRTEAH